MAAAIGDGDGDGDGDKTRYKAHTSREHAACNKPPTAENSRESQQV